MVWAAHEITQLGYICRKLEDGIDFFVKHRGAGPFYVMEVPPDAAEYTYLGHPVAGVTKNRVAFGYCGRDQIELIETDNPVFDHLRGDADIVFHHVMQMSASFERDRSAYQEAGFATLGTGQMPGVLIHYIDTMERLGHYTELFNYDSAMRETDGAMFKLFEHMHATACGWDGSDAVRSLDELAAQVFAPASD
jgi:hypothetical protein